MDIEKARIFILDRIETSLPSNLYYHQLAHTLDVYEAATRIAKDEGVNEHRLLLIQTAALFHDAGMIERYIDHEEVSMKMALQYLPRFGYVNGDIELIARMILATKLPQSADILEEKILCDADLDYLGRDDFFMIAMRLHHEWNTIGRYSNLRQWYELQEEFLSSHIYLTATAQATRNPQKHKNILEIRELLGQR